MQLADVIPWGRSLDEYRAMFDLSDTDLSRRILGCGDGPASFNAEGTALGHAVTSCDPIYAFTGPQIEARVYECYPAMIAQVKQQPDRFRWDFFRDPDHLVEYRLAAMSRFLADYESGEAEGRYVAAALPRLPFADRAFEIALSSHFLFLYSSHFDADFHRRSIVEMLRVAGEVRVFPLLDLNGRASAHVQTVTDYLVARGYQVEICRVAYEFQRGGHEMLRLGRR
ncbi:MAG TPA: hypothetical protein VHD36_21880 [Pirellulales bacterium]|nr:hypothetical protein [Pirellulales bacterium]